MYKRRCSWCKRVMYFKLGESIKMFCSKECHAMDRQKRFASEDCGPPMKMLTADDITDEGYIALVKAMVSRAGQDVKKYKPGTQIRNSAEKFFESDYFTDLTGLDGDPILQKLKEEYKRRQKRTTKYPKIKVQCIETGEVYASINEAAGVFGISPKGIYDVLNGHGKTSAGMHWKYAEERK